MAASSGWRRRSRAATCSIFADREAVVLTAADVSTTSLKSTVRLLETDWQSHRERRAVAYVTLHRDGPAVAVQDVPRAGQTHARAADPLLAVAGPLKSLEDAPVVAL